MTEPAISPATPARPSRLGLWSALLGIAGLLLFLGFTALSFALACAPGSPPAIIGAALARVAAALSTLPAQVAAVLGGIALRRPGPKAGAIIGLIAGALCVLAFAFRVLALPLALR